MSERLESSYKTLRCNYEPENDSSEYKIRCEVLLDKIEYIARKRKPIHWFIKEDLENLLYVPTQQLDHKIGFTCERTLSSC